MEMENALRQSLDQLVMLQAQQLNAINTLVGQNLQPDSRMGQMSPSATQMNMSSYSNYSPDFMPPMMQSPMEVDAKRRYGEQLGHLRQGPGFFNSAIANGDRVSHDQRTAMMNNYAGRFGTAAMAGAGSAAAGAAGLFGMMAAPGLLSSMAVGGLAGGVVGGFFDIGINQTKQHLAYNEFLLRESHRFINPAESNNKRGIGGFSTDERFEASKFLRHFNTGKNISDQETSMLLERFTEGGLLKSASDLDSFKDRMSKLTDFVKKSALTLNETYENIANLMGDLEKAGINVANFDYLSAKSKVLGSFTGKSAMETLQFTTGTGQAITQGTNISSTVMTERVQDTMLYMDAMRTSLKNSSGPLSPREEQVLNSINNMGGVEGATGIATQYQNRLMGSQEMRNAGALFFDYNEDSNEFLFNSDRFRSYTSGDRSMIEINKDIASQMNSMGVAGKNEWMRSGATYLSNALSDSQSKDFILRNLDAIRRSSSNDEIRNGNLSSTDLLSLIFQDNSDTARVYGSLLDYYGADGGNLANYMNTKTAQESFVAQLNSQRSGVGGWIRNNLWEKPKDMIGDRFTPFGELAVRAGEGFQDWWHGPMYTGENLGKGRDFSIGAVFGEGGIGQYAKQDFVRSLDRVSGSTDLSKSNKLIEHYMSIGKWDGAFGEGGVASGKYGSSPAEAATGILKNLASVYGIDYTGDATSVRALSAKMATEAVKIDEMLSNAWSDKGEFYNLSTAEKIAIVEQRQAISNIRNEGTAYDTNLYLLNSDHEEIEKVSRGFWSNKTTYDDSGKRRGKGGDAREYLEWIETSGAIKSLTGDYESTGRSVAGAMSEANTKYWAAKKEQDRISMEEVGPLLDSILRDGVPDEFKAKSADIIKALTDNDMKALDKALERPRTRGPQRNSDGYSDFMTKISSVMRSFESADTSKYYHELKGLQDVTGTIDFMGDAGSILMGALGGDSEAFSKKYSADWANIKDPKDIDNFKGFAAAGYTELAHQLAITMEKKDGIKNLQDKLTPFLPKTELDDLVTTLTSLRTYEPADASGPSKQEVLADLIGQKLTQMDASAGALDSERKADESRDAGTKLDEATKGLISTVLNNVDTMISTTGELDGRVSKLEGRRNFRIRN